MNIISKPILTEKMTQQSEKLNEYGFFVNPKANKLQIKTAIETQYGVVVERVNTMNYDGKVKSRYSKSGYLVGKNNNTKKAIVKLKTGDTIDFYSNI